MFRRNAKAIQGATDPCVESLLDLVELNLDFAAHSAHFLAGFVDLVVGRIELCVDTFLAALLDAFTGLDQLFEVVRTFLTDAGVGAQACQPDFARVATHLVQGARRLVLFLHIHFGHALYLMLIRGGRNCPWGLGLKHKVGRKIRILTLGWRLIYLPQAVRAAALAFQPSNDWSPTPCLLLPLSLIMPSNVL
ncbi:hypothetical protein D3C81_601160 [compost metagenome]